MIIVEHLFYIVYLFKGSCLCDTVNSAIWLMLLFLIRWLGRSRAVVIPQSQLAWDWFASILRRISRHFPVPPWDSLLLPGHFWESGGHRVTFNSNLKPGAAFLIAIWSPINRSMPGQCWVGHRKHRAAAGPNFEHPRQSIRRPDAAQTPPKWRLGPVRRPANLAGPGRKPARHRKDIAAHSTGTLQMPARPPYGM